MNKVINIESYKKIKLFLSNGETLLDYNLRLQGIFDIPKVFFKGPFEMDIPEVFKKSELVHSYRMKVIDPISFVKTLYRTDIDLT